MSLNVARGYSELRTHIGHAIACVAYRGAPGSAPANVALECEDCGVVLLDFDRPANQTVLEQLRATGWLSVANDLEDMTGEQAMGDTDALRTVLRRLAASGASDSTASAIIQSALGEIEPEPDATVCEHGNWMHRDCEACGRILEGDLD